MEFFTHKTDLQELIENTPILVLQFGSESCMPCHALRRKLDHWSGTIPGTLCMYIPVEEFPQLAAQSGIFTVPAILVYIQGKLFIQESGYFSLDKILSRIHNIYQLISP